MCSTYVRNTASSHKSPALAHAPYAARTGRRGTPATSHAPVVRVHVASGVSGVRSFDNAKSFEMSSFSEKKAQKWAIDQKEKFQQYNSRQLSRIYPAGKRRPDDCSLTASAQPLDSGGDVGLAERHILRPSADAVQFC